MAEENKVNEAKEVPDINAVAAQALLLFSEFINIMCTRLDSLEKDINELKGNGLKKLSNGLH